MVRKLRVDNVQVVIIVGDAMGCLKIAYHIRRTKKVLEDSPEYSVQRASIIAADIVGASEWDAELVTMIMTHCPDDAVKWGKSIMKRTKESIDALEW